MGNPEKNEGGEFKEAHDQIDAWSKEKSRELDFSVKKQNKERLTNWIKELEAQKKEIELREINDRFKKSLIEQVEQKIISARQELEALGQ